MGYTTYGYGSIEIKEGSLKILKEKIEDFDSFFEEISDEDLNFQFDGKYATDWADKNCPIIAEHAVTGTLYFDGEDSEDRWRVVFNGDGTYKDDMCQFIYGDVVDWCLENWKLTPTLKMELEKMKVLKRMED